MIQIKAIHRYPVKGLSVETLQRVEFAARQGLPFDRVFAIARANAPFDPNEPKHLPKANFLMLMRDEDLALLQTRFDPETRTLSIDRDGGTAIEGKLDDAADRARFEAFFQDFLGLGERPKLFHVPGHMFSDRAEKVVSILNLASVRDLAAKIGAPVDPVRFRANLLIDGDLPAWAEFDWPGKRVRIGGATVEVIDPIRRCAATTVNPTTAARDLKIPTFLMETYGHMNTGIYARVVTGGTAAVGDMIELQP